MNDESETLCDRCSKAMPESDAITGDEECGEWEGCTLCVDCEIELRTEAGKQ